MKRKMIKNIAWICVLLLAIASIGCSKNASAEEIAGTFMTDIESGKAYKMVHTYKETQEVVELYRSTSGNIKIVYHNEDGTIDEVYKIDDTYSLYMDGQIAEGYDVSDLEGLVNESLEEVAFYVEDTLEVFQLDIDSDIVDVKEDNLYMAMGEYDDGTDYYYSYGKDGSFFKYLDNYDDLRIDLDDTIVIELP